MISPRSALGTWRVAQIRAICGPAVRDRGIKGQPTGWLHLSSHDQLVGQQPNYLSGT